VAETVRGMIRDIQVAIRDTDLEPMQAAEYLNKLSALYGNCMEESREAEMLWNGVLLDRMSGEEPANRATIRAKATPEYARLREAQDTCKLVLEMVRSLKALIRLKEEEMRLSR
jgi:hypothetical protein